MDLQQIAVPRKNLKRIRARIDRLELIIAREGSRTPTGQLSQAELRALQSVLWHIDHCPWGKDRPEKHVAPFPSEEQQA